ncbi:MAG: HAD-IA family hydrolase [Pseudomonadota bacterium]
MGTVVFDLDGTLADTSGDLIEAANVCFREMGAGDVIRPGLDADTALTGGKAMLRLGLSRLGQEPDEDEVDRWYPMLLEAYEAKIDHHTVFFPGAMDAVRALKAQNHRVAICTNKPEKLARLLFQSLGALDEFHSLIGADTLPVRKPDPEPLREAVRRAGGDLGQTIMIGDTITDHSTARAAGVPSILVTFAPGREKVAEMEPDALLHHFDELLDLANQYFTAS